MSIPLGVALYFLIWWVVLFAVLPFGLKTQDEDGEVVPGTPGSAPAKTRGHQRGCGAGFCRCLGRHHVQVGFDHRYNAARLVLTLWGMIDGCREFLLGDCFAAGF